MKREIKSIKFYFMSSVMSDSDIKAEKEAMTESTKNGENLT